MYVISRNITPRRAHICIYDVDASKKTICYAVGKVIYFIVQRQVSKELTIENIIERGTIINKHIFKRFISKAKVQNLCNNNITCICASLHCSFNHDLFLNLGWQY